MTFKALQGQASSYILDAELISADSFSPQNRILMKV